MSTRFTPFALAVAFATSASLPLAATAAGDQPAAPPAGGSSSAATASSVFAELDKNKDGFVTRDEAKLAPDVTAAFTDIDANHDSKISMSEWVGYLKRGAAGSGSGAAGPQGPAGSPGAGGSPGPDESPGPAGTSPSPKSKY